MDVASTRWEWQKRRALWHLLRHTRRRPRSIQASRNTPGLSSHGRSFTSFIVPSTLEKTLMWRHCADWVITVKLIVEIDSTHIWRIGWKLDREIYLFIRFDKNGALDGWDTNWNNIQMNISFSTMFFKLISNIEMSLQNVIPPCFMYCDRVSSRTFIFTLRMSWCEGEMWAYSFGCELLGLHLVDLMHCLNDQGLVVR